jgi:tetratricopeptide (TPR) repeat protein
MDPEDVRTLVQSCMAKLGAIVERYGGYVDKVIGDALMAVFGAPVAHEDDPERAVRAALEMQRCAVENASEFGNLALRVGVNTGEVMFAPVQEGGTATAIGDAVNVAQRIQSEAPQGGVLVGEETYRANRGGVRFEEAAAVVAKGKELPVPVWLALEAPGVPAERAVLSAPLIGRDSELALLTGIWERVASERRAHLATVVGPPGIGKTRLAGEVAAQAERSGGRALRGRSLPYGETSGYGAFAQQVKGLAEIFESDSTPVARAKLDAAVASVLPGEDAADTAGHLAALIGLGEEAGDKAVLFFSARRFAEALARERPTLLVFEDVHWADASLLDLVEAIAGRVRDVPLFLLVLARPELREVRPAWGSGLPASTSLRLDPLGERESIELAARLLAQRAGPAAEDVVARLGEMAEGNPLFIEELAASLVERATDTVAELPTTVKGIIAARLDALPPEERAAVLDASVIGKVFWRGALARLSARPERLPAVLDSLEGRDLVRREGASRIQGDEEFVFKHMLIREVAYATLPKAIRPERHAAVARFIEESAGDRIGESAAVLAYHWEQAGERPKAIAYTVAAAEQAGRAWAKGEAVSLYERALELMPEDAREERVRVGLARARALVEAGEFKAAVPALDELLEDLTGRERFEALHARFKATFWGLTDALGSRRFATAARELAEELGDNELRALAVSKQAAAAAMDGEVEEGLGLGREALGGWQPSARPNERAEALEWHSLHHYWLGRYEGALAPAKEAIEIGERVYSIIGLVNGHADLGLALTGLGRHEEALAVFARGAAHGRELELQPRFTSRLLNMWAGSLRELHELDEARRLNEEAIEESSRVSFPGGIVSGKIDVLQLDLAVGDVGKAESALPELTEAAAGTKGWHQWLWTTRIAAARAGIELAAGRHEEAAAAARQALERARRYRRLKYVVASRTALGEALFHLGQGPAACDVFRQALAEAETLRHPPSLWRAAAGLARTLYALGDDSGAEAAAAKAREEVDAFARGLADERRERFLRAPQVAELLAVAR